MPFNGIGVFQRLRNWVADAAAGIKIRADYHDAEDDGFAAGLSNCITKDGQTLVTQNIPLNSSGSRASKTRSTRRTRRPKLMPIPSCPPAAAPSTAISTSRARRVSAYGYRHRVRRTPATSTATTGSIFHGDGTA